MRIFLNIIGVIVAAVGAIWFLQGLNILRQSVMSGHRRWIVIGAGLIIIGIVVMVVGNRRKKVSPSK